MAFLEGALLLEGCYKQNFKLNNILTFRKTLTILCLLRLNTIHRLHQLFNKTKISCDIIISYTVVSLTSFSIYICMYYENEIAKCVLLMVILRLITINYSHRALIINFSLHFFFDGELLGGGG